MPKVVVFYGPDKEFSGLLTKRISKDEDTVEFLSVIRKYNAQVRASDLPVSEVELSNKASVDNCIVRSDDFGSVLSHAVSNFASIIAQSYEAANIFVQNPPTKAYESLRAFYPEDIETIYTQYQRMDKSALKASYELLKQKIVGQDDCLLKLISSLYKLSCFGEEKPAVVLLYGPSGVGKTETAKCLSEALGGALTRTQFSMMQTNESADYLFGAEHSKNSFARDLLKRESNVVLLDEFDKVNSLFYNAFYQLFDEGIFVDTNYTVNMAGSIFLCTSNFATEHEAMRALGPAMFSRIDSCIEYGELPDFAKIKILSSHYESILSRIDDEDAKAVGTTRIYDWFEDNVERYSNVRLMKAKLENAIFDELANRLINNQTN